MLTAVLVGLLALGLSAFTYLALERLGRRAVVPLICRAVAWTALGLLLVNLSCPVRTAPLRPLILLDASLSLGAAGGHWREARDSALRWGEVRTFGDERQGSDTTPTRGRSLLAPALLAASASERPVIVVSDGEIEDTREIPPDILSRSGVRLFHRNQRQDLAITRVSGPRRVSAGDSIALEVLVQAVGQETRDTVTVQVMAGKTRLARRTLRLRGEGAGRARIAVSSRALAAGDHVLRVSLGQSDAEPRTDSRLHIVTVAATPGVVLLAGPADWDSRFLYQTVREVSQLPVRGFVRLEGNRWRSMSDLRPVPTEYVRRAARRADLLVLKGGVGSMAEGSRARGVWVWPSGENGEPQAPGDWYLLAGESSPISGAFLGQPVDSFPPAMQLTALDPGSRAWVALFAQLGRRGPQKAAVFGAERGGVRRVTVAVDGLWRWAFRGGSSDQTYRSWVAATASWLLGGVDSARGLARPLQPVVANGRPIVFEWVGAGVPTPVVVRWSGNAAERSDTLHFDGEGRATVWQEPGEYHYRLGGGGGGTVAVEQYSDELLPRPVALTSHEPRASRPSARSSAREWLWLFGLCILALSGEWFARRRLGLR
jgi:type IV pilus biogenesis protein CpaD/CtpE